MSFPEARACVSCGASLAGPFCSACGERVVEPDDFKVRRILASWLDSSFNLDGRLLRTVRLLLFAPGELTREWCLGRRVGYSKPIAIFLFVNVLFFLVQPHTGIISYGLRGYVGSVEAPHPGLELELVQARLAASGEERAAFEARFDATLQGQKKSLFLLMIPCIALVLKLLHARRTFAEHLVFSIHLFAYFLVALVLGLVPLLLLVGAVLGQLGTRGAALNQVVSAEPFLVLLLTGLLMNYLVRAQGRVYGFRRLPAVVRALAVVLALFLLMVGFAKGLFFSTLWAL